MSRRGTRRALVSPMLVLAIACSCGRPSSAPEHHGFSGPSIFPPGALTSLTDCSGGAPTVNHGTLGGGATDCIGNITAIGSSSTTLTYSEPKWTSSWCQATSNSGSGIAQLIASSSPLAATFSCYATGALINCPNLSYFCAGGGSSYVVDAAIDAAPDADKHDAPIDGPTGWTIDPTSGIACPANSGEWANLITAAGLTNSGPAAIYSFQDGSSPIADANGTYPLSQVSTHHLYQQAQPGWTREAAENLYIGVDNGFVLQGSPWPNPASNSFLLMAWVALTATPSANSGLLSVTDSSFHGGVEVTSLYPLIGNTSEQSRGSTPLPSSGGFPIALKYDITHGVTKFYTPYEIINESYANTSAGAEVDFGVAEASQIWAASANYLWGSVFTGAAAELQDNDIGALWTTAGWTPRWYAAPQADGTSGKYWPLAKNQWSHLSLSPPSFDWSMQESAEITFNDYIGNVGNSPLLKTGTYASSISLAQTVSGWSRLSVKTTDGTASQVLSTTCSLLPALSSSSQALLIEAQVNSAASGTSPYYSWVAGIGTAQILAIHVSPSGVFGLDVSTSHYNGAAAQSGHVVLLLLVYDKTNSRIVLYTPAEKITATYNAFGSTGQGLYLGSTSGVVPAAGINILGAALYSGSTAEIQDATARTLFTTLGFTEAF